MIQCDICQTLHVQNTLFCSECSTYLIKDVERGTAHLDIRKTAWLATATAKPKNGLMRSQAARPRTIRLRIGAGRREVEMRLNKTIHMGRVDPTETVYPEVDLTDSGVPGRSVSRRHARILRQNQVVFIEDLGSFNGTFINGARLAPYIPEAIRDGDTLQLGRLLIEVKIQKQ